MTSVITSMIRVPDLLAQIDKRINAAYEQTCRSRKEWIEGTLDLALALAEARTCLPSNKEYSAWIADNGHDRISHHDRAALISMVSAEAIEITKDVLSKTDRWSWRYIWECEIEPRLTRVGKTAEAPPDEAAPDDQAASPPQPIPAVRRVNWFDAFKQFRARVAGAADRDDRFNTAAADAMIEQIDQIVAELDRFRKKLEAMR